MSDFNDQKEWLESGKQLGTVFSFIQEGKVYWSSVGIQKHNGLYKVYIDEIEETKMDVEEYEKELKINFNNIQDSIDYIKNNSKADVFTLAPCKGQKVFNPNFQ